MMAGGEPAIAGVILAGGRAQRMGGGDKCLLDLDGAPVLAHVIERLAPQVAALALNANGDPARFAGFGLPVIADGIAGFPGPLAGILAGLDWAAAQGISRVVTVAADTPCFPCDLVARFRAAASGVTIAETAETGCHPVFGLWPVGLRERLRADILAGARRVRAWAEAQGAARVRFAAAAGDPFFNINTAEDLAAARALLALRQESGPERDDGLSRRSR